MTGTEKRVHFTEGTKFCFWYTGLDGALSYNIQHSLD